MLKEGFLTGGKLASWSTPKVVSGYSTGVVTHGRLLTKVVPDVGRFVSPG